MIMKLYSSSTEQIKITAGMHTTPTLLIVLNLNIGLKKAPPIIFKLCLGMITAGQKKISFGLDLCF